MNEFLSDDKWQRDQRDSILVPNFYRRFFWMRHEFMDGNMEFQNRGVDTIIYGKDKPVYIEEKIVRWPEKRGLAYGAFSLETKSCTVEGHEKSGWMFYGEAHRLLYCFQLRDGTLDCWWLDFPALQQWFWPQENAFPQFKMTTKNKTAGRVVPIRNLCENVSWLNFKVAK